MEELFMIVGFLFAAYSVVGNDVIQTLGTFLSSNKQRPWWVLWLFTSSILSVVLLYGWANYGGDVSHGRLTKVGDLPSPFHWWYVLPPLVLMLITRFGIPVSTTFLIISVFQTKLIEDMIYKSLSGYLVAFLSALLIYAAVSRFLERRFIENPITASQQRLWTVLQWLSTGFLWSQWLIQDLANIYVYLPRQLPLEHILLSLAALLVLQAYIFYNRGGKIQKIVTSKTNTTDIRSATIIDFIYGIILLIFKEYSQIPMSTTWVFVGLLAGRELMLTQSLRIKPLAEVARLVFKDALKITFGILVSIGLVILIQQLKG